MAWPPNTHQDVQDTITNQRSGIQNVKDFGATGNGTTDDTAAIQSAIAAVPGGDGGVLYFPAGTYLISGTLDFGTKLAVSVIGSGHQGQNGTVANGTTVIRYTGSDWAIRWNTAGAASTLFNGFHVQQLHIKGTSAGAGGIWIGNGSNSVVRDVTVSDFRNATTSGTGLRIGTTNSGGAQYNVAENVIVSACDIGVDNLGANGTRIIGGFLEDQMPVPRAGTVAVKSSNLCDTLIMVGTIVQGWETHISVASPACTFLGVRHESFTTAYSVTSPGIEGSIIGGSMNNSYNASSGGNAGTGFSLGASVSNWLILRPHLNTVGTPIVDAGSNNTYFIGHDAASRLGDALAMGPNNAIGFYGTTPVAKRTVTGAKGSNAALGSLLSALSALGLITDSTTT